MFDSEIGSVSYITMISDNDWAKIIFQSETWVVVFTVHAFNETGAQMPCVSNESQNGSVMG